MICGNIWSNAQLACSITLQLFYKMSSNNHHSNNRVYKLKRVIELQFIQFKRKRILQSMFIRRSSYFYELTKVWYLIANYIKYNLVVFPLYNILRENDTEIRWRVMWTLYLHIYDWVLDNNIFIEYLPRNFDGTNYIIVLLYTIYSVYT